jgi:replicative DNA helicase
MSGELSKTPPYNVEAEEALLGCCLIEPESIMGLCREKGLQAESFSRPSHIILWKILDQMDRERYGIDIITVLDRMKSVKLSTYEGRKNDPDGDKSVDDVIDGMKLLMRITSRIESTVYAHHWLELIMDKWTLRKLIVATTKALERCYMPDESPASEILLETQQAVFGITDTSDDNSPKSMKNARKILDERMIARQARKGMGSVTSGLDELDKITGGIDSSEFVVIAADPKGGKTALALCYAESVLWPTSMYIEPASVLMFSLEMDASEVMQRIAQKRNCINIRRVREGFSEEIHRFNNGLHEVEEASLYVFDNPDMTIADIRTYARRHIQKHPDTALIIIDHMGLVKSSDKRMFNRNDVNTSITRECKRMSKEFHRPVILCAQMNRQNRKDKKDEDSYQSPIPAMIAYGTGCEEDANKIILIGVKSKTEREIVVAYQREGGSGSFWPAFCDWCVRFDNPGEGPNHSTRQQPIKQPEEDLF